VAFLTSRYVLLAAAVTLVSSLCPAQNDAAPLEYQVKAAFLFNFLKFVEWPAVANTAPWVIGVLGSDPFGDILDTTVRGKIVNGRPVEVRHYSKLNDVKDCNILFIGRSEFERTGAPVQPGLLTVGEASGFLKSGGIINFYTLDNHVHFEIRATVARSVGLRLSSQLLKLGRTL
jgi:hypothetical protein